MKNNVMARCVIFSLLLQFIDASFHLPLTSLQLLLCVYSDVLIFPYAHPQIAIYLAKQNA